ncbi:hypothetical protein KGY14_03015 [Ameyamaea chiangmaiensis]|uniref:Uncharacterized protein n=1 Tax=Ameyamaea chiangmaiensis TaxID=442969 RepID=A0A850PDJ0_9PROT|nr:hypothetical protein [Ameyamaea chiangmaiensis]MBS4074158.1 hypothetical protein [Ameyamaea chiangmaiensis]NVN39101.1 hypothetical protein [Ameyamaea chiangmaiensis]
MAFAVVAFLIVPETRGVPLPCIERNLRDADRLRDLGRRRPDTVTPG